MAWFSSTAIVVAVVTPFVPVGSAVGNAVQVWAMAPAVAPFATVLNRLVVVPLVVARYSVSVVPGSIAMPVENVGVAGRPVQGCWLQLVPFETPTKTACTPWHVRKAMPGERV